MNRLVASISTIVSLLAVCVPLQAQSPVPGATIRVRPATAPVGFRVAWTEAQWVGVSGDSLVYQMASGASLKLPVDGTEVQRQGGDRARLYGVVGGLVGAGAGALVRLLGSYDEEWAPGREAGCTGSMAWGGANRCYSAQSPRLLSSKRDEVVVGAVVGGLVGAAIGGFIGLRTPGWVAVDPLDAAVRFSLPAR